MLRHSFFFEFLPSWSTYIHDNFSVLTTFGPKPWASLELRSLTVTGCKLVRWLVDIEYFTFDGNIISRNWLQANPGVQVPGWSLSSLQAHWWVFLLIKTSIIVVGVVGEGHGTGPSHPVAQQVLREMILGEVWALIPKSLHLIINYWHISWNIKTYSKQARDFERIFRSNYHK